MRSIVLLSAGLDSSVNLAMAAAETEVVTALTFDYGQKAAAKEIERAKAMAKRYSITHSVIDLSFLRTPLSALTGPESVPTISENDLKNGGKTAASAASVWVPNRNGVFVNVGAAVAEASQAGLLVAGFNEEEAVSFPDNSADFVDAANRAFSFSTRGRVVLTSYTQELVKAEIIALGLELNAPFDLIWSCYKAEELMCGVCESCARFKRAARQAGAAYLIEGRFAVDN
ncbi:MAG: 7-cyano-7-deazaguanine synthase QueC [Actinomycetota bacterium]